MLGVFIGGTETVPKIVAHGLWELGRRPDQMAAVRADLDAKCRVAREEMIRYCAPAQWFARTVRKPFTIHDTTIEPGQRIITLLASANRDEREYADPDEFVWDRRDRAPAGLRPRTALLPRCAPGPAGDHDHGVRVAEAGARLPHRQRGRVAAAVELPVGLEQHPCGGLTVWSYRLVAPYTFERVDIPEKTPESLGDRQVLVRFLAAGVCGSDLPGFRGAKGRLPGDVGTQCRGDGRLSDPRDRRRSRREHAPEPRRRRPRRRLGIGLRRIDGIRRRRRRRPGAVRPVAGCRSMRWHCSRWRACCTRSSSFRS